MKVRNLLLIGLTSVMAWSCSDDELQGGNNNKPASSKNYIEVSIKMPTTTRTATPGQGEEVGLDFENEVNSVLILAVEAEGNVGENFTKENVLQLARVVSSSDGGLYVDYQKATAILKNITLDIHKLYTIYAFVNPTEEMISNYQSMVGSIWNKDGVISPTSYNDAYTFIESMTFKGYTKRDFSRDGTESIKGNFLMTDTKATGVNSRGIKAVYKFDDLGDNMYKLTAATNVERAVARFDYKNNGLYKLPNGPTGDQLMDGKGSKEELKIELIGYKIMNIGKSFYHLKRVSDTFQGVNYDYGGIELPNNYVVDADWEKKKEWLKSLEEAEQEETTFDIKSLFFVPLNGNDSDDYISLDGLFEDNDENWSGNEGEILDRNNYKVLAYCTENTIPSDNEQLNGLSTAIVFKAEITGDFIEEETIALYRYNNTIYNNWDRVWEQYKGENSEASISTENEYYEQCQTAGKTPEITRWKVDNRKAYCYYAYWNRHNDNGISTVMGPMEFAVVRNNIYKLDVQAIYKLGSPTDPTNPDKEDPWEPAEPDEKNEIEMTVEVKVLNWAVRLNHIEFD